MGSEEAFISDFFVLCGVWVVCSDPKVGLSWRNGMNVVDYAQGITQEHLRLLADWLSTSILHKKAAAQRPAALAQDMGIRVVFLSLSDQKGNVVTASAMGLGICAAAEKALQACTQNFPQETVCFRVDLVAETMLIAADRVKANELVVADPSLLGVALDDFNQAWLAEENLRYGLLTPTRGLNFGAIKEHLAGRVHSETPEKVWCFVTAARYVSVVKDKIENIPLIRGHREQLTVTQELAKSRALAGANYLARAVRENGSFVYQYESGLDIETDDYNMVRHAGTLWSMLDILTVDENSLLRDAVQRAAGYLRTTIEPYAYGSGLIINEFDTAKLGGNGLGLVALAEYYRFYPSSELLAELRGLAEWIVASQAADGEYASHKVDLSTGEVARFLSDYYPGEAILGLMRLATIEPDQVLKQKWQKSAITAARWLIHVRDKGKELVELEHDHWLLYGLNEVYRVEQDADFLAHTRRLVEAILTTQVGSAFGPTAGHPDWQGGWYEPPRTTPVACRVEGLMAAVKLLTDFGEESEVKPLLLAAQAGLAFMLQNQLWGEKLMFLPNPERAMGGFHSDFNNWHIRIDFVQHSISALIAYAQA